jgi:hypothetical protein
VELQAVILRNCMTTVCSGQQLIYALPQCACACAGACAAGKADQGQVRHSAMVTQACLLRAHCTQKAACLLESCCILLQHNDMVCVRTTFVPGHAGAAGGRAAGAAGALAAVRSQ